MYTASYVIVWTLGYTECLGYNTLYRSNECDKILNSYFQS